ncbi:unnamed protein product [Allacma fusca]|uniref:Uncharacterized protein n=1 Tax=Allacma fusca TaxID=39272 RepID=A0A8J2KUF6_9HEXA|nr:unnamed protein product [Allacma fusca]
MSESHTTKKLQPLINDNIPIKVGSLNMWVVNYAAPGMAIAGLGMTYYALMKKELNLERQNQDYTTYVLDIMKRGQEKNDIPDLKSSRSVVTMRRCLREPRRAVLRSKSVVGKRIPLKATVSLASSEKMLHKLSRNRKCNKTSSSYTYLKVKFDEIRGQTNIAMLSASNPQISVGGEKIPNLENVISRASLGGTSPVSLVTSRLTPHPIYVSSPILTPGTDMENTSPVTPTEGFRELQNLNLIAESTPGLGPMQNNDSQNHLIMSGITEREESSGSFSDKNDNDSSLQTSGSNSNIDLGEDLLSIDKSRSGSAITVIHASSSMIISQRRWKARLESETSIQTVFISETNDMKNVRRRSRSVCQLNRSYDDLISQRCGGDMNKSDLFQESLKDYNSFLHPTFSNPELKNYAKASKAKSNPEDSTQFLMPPTANETDSVMSNSTDSLRITSSSDTTPLTRNMSKSCNYLKLHELAVEEILKENEEFVNPVRTQSLPDVLEKDERYGLNCLEVPGSSNLSLKLTFLQIPLRKLKDQTSINLILSALFVLLLWSFFDYLADQNPRKVKFSWHW